MLVLLRVTGPLSDAITWRLPLTPSPNELPLSPEASAQSPAAGGRVEGGYKLLLSVSFSSGEIVSDGRMPYTNSPPSSLSFPHIYPCPRGPRMFFSKLTPNKTRDDRQTDWLCWQFIPTATTTAAFSLGVTSHAIPCN